MTTSLPTNAQLHEPLAQAEPYTQPALAQNDANQELLLLAQQCASAAALAPAPTKTLDLLDRVTQMAVSLRQAHRHFLGSNAESLSLPYAAEWLLDNFHVLEQALRHIKLDLPPGYYRQLPQLAAGEFACHPRIYALTHTFIRHEECYFNAARYRQFIRAYQQFQPLTIGELWALPTMLRIALIEQLACTASSISATALDAHTFRHTLAPHSALSETDIVANSITSLRAVNVLEWQEFFEEVSLVHQELANDPAGLFAWMDFPTRDRYRQVIEKVARRKPFQSGQAELVIAQQAIALAQAAQQQADPPLNSTDPAAKLPLEQLDLRQPRTQHVGYYLLDAGREALEAKVGYRPTLIERLQRWLLQHATATYLSGIGLPSLLILGWVSHYIWQSDARPLPLPWTLLLAGLVTLIPAITIGVNLVNWLITKVLPPRLLPKLDFKQGIPAACRAMVVTPVLLAHADEVETLFAQLELHYLRNPEANLTFAILSDFADAPQQQMPADQELLTSARQQLAALNQKYPQQPFYFFHRYRQWNAQEGSWMGWERKRGKLHEFNHLLRGATNSSFDIQLGNLAILPQVQYVITLDADTVLPSEGAQRLIGTLAHPLNRALFDEQSGKVIAGYTILQPRTAIKPTSANLSLFTRIFSGDVGIDLYTMAVSDAYQDLFGVGIYVGKGIYEVDSFERSLHHRVPENSLLSHDLFEGVHGRAALVSDIVLYESYPPHYLINVMRSHRWVRGDWQLLPWLLPRTPSRTDSLIGSPLEQNTIGQSTVEQGTGSQATGDLIYQRNDLALIDRWKIADNLRRSIFPPALLAFFVIGWTLLPGSPLFWTLIGLLPALISLFTVLLSALWGKLHKWERPWPVTLRPLRNDALRWLLFLAFLPFESLVLIDAIFTTLHRVFHSRRRLLQWTTAEHAIRLMGGEITAESTLRRLLPSMVLVVLVTLVVALAEPVALWLAAPFILLWLGAWRIAWWISRPDAPSEEPVSSAQIDQLHRLARRTWLFYEEFVGPGSNWLPPDHFQETPLGVVAHSTSPTNTGLYLLSVLAAHDFGYITTTHLSLRLRFAFESMEKLGRYRGHFLNWIDTRTLEPLNPRYISTVDSGNLAGSLITLRQGCLQLASQPLWHAELWAGVIDFLALLDEAVCAPTVAVGAQPTTEQADPLSFVTEPFAPVLAEEPNASALRSFIAQTQRRIRASQEQPELWATLLLDLAGPGRAQLDSLLIAFIEANAGQINGEQVRDYRILSERYYFHLNTMQREVADLMPWLIARIHAPASLARMNTPGVAAAWQHLWQTTFTNNPPLAEIAHICKAGALAMEQLAALIAQESPANAPDALAWCDQLQQQLRQTQQSAETLLNTLADLEDQAERYVQEMDFTFLFDAQRQVFHIGYNLEAEQLDNSYYDLLASEARIASLVAIAKQEVPHSHWLHLGRPITESDNGEMVLLSWSGTMFEYLMPALFTHTYPGTLLYQSCYSCIAQQITFGKSKKTPWGVSESGFYTFDAAMNYQYYAFGVPGLGFKRERDEDLVITPYASLLALPFRPQAVLANLSALYRQGMMGRYGLYEAADYTPERLALGQEKMVVRSYMAHHQGMIMLALANFLQDKRMVKRFHADARIQSVEMLLQEQIPHDAPLQFPHEEADNLARPATSSVAIHPWNVPTETPMPLVHYLSNGNYGLLITNSGAGYSQWKGLQLTRWQPDTTLDHAGSWLYLHDLENDYTWSATRQPTNHTAEQEEVTFYPHMVKFVRHEQQISLHTEVCVAAEEDVEIRRVTLTNLSDQPRHLRLTSYSEVVLAPAAADQRHPAFVKLFVESEFVSEMETLLLRRRPRSANEEQHFVAHMLIHAPGQEESAGLLSHESDRANFLGRAHSVRDPLAVHNGTKLSGTVGATLDPIMALSQELQLAPHATLQLAVMTLTAPTRPAILSLCRRYQAWATVDRAFMHARSAAESELRRLELPSTHLEQIQYLLSLLLYPHPARRAPVATLAANQRGQSGLWAYGISGDYPILLLRLNEEVEGELLQQLLVAHNWWRRRGLQIDLVILNQQPSNYGQAVQNFILRTIRRLDSEQWLNQRGGIFLLYEDQIGEAERTLLYSAARVLLNGADGLLAQQLNGLFQQPQALPLLMPVAGLPEQEMLPLARPSDLRFDNDLGGFSADGREYVIYLAPGEQTPAPWSNVIANPDFGTLVTESGGGYSWASNSGDNRLTPWRNDPVSDTPSEVIYLRDEETAQLWSPTPLPAPAAAPYLVRHGAGYTIFEHDSHQLKQQLRLFVAPNAPLKLVCLRLENSSQRPRRITATCYAEWVLGAERPATQQYMIPEYDAQSWTLLARNPYNNEFGERVAFMASNKEPHGLTSDRSEFLGRLGDPRRPAALQRVGLAGRVEAGLDPCAALQLHIDLPPGGQEEVYFLIGQAAGRAEALQLVRHFQAPEAIATTWQQVQSQWDEILGSIQVQTPDEGMNLLLNRWLLYQTLACRIWGRSALYQSSGAFGFRDQLQDVMAVIHARPDLARAHIVESAQHQFEAGDVLHWWHPPSGRGVRTRMSDDLLWLPYVTAYYVRMTGDLSILEAQVPFLQAEPLRANEEERYAHYSATSQSYSLFEHCRRALLKGTTAGVHGIPLMGAGDWNDGMNRVGIEGKGESVWLGWFLVSTLNSFADLCETKGETPSAVAYRQQAVAIHQALEQHAWDGNWYKRAWYDDGTPLGAQQNRECQIDSIAQSWSVLSGVGDRTRSERAMQSVLERLVNWQDGLILLFTPAFDKTSHDPGYIKGYLPGIRENGGQYTHAALWAIGALAQLGQGDLAEQLFKLISPIEHSNSRAQMERYKVEPYVVAADIYGVAQQAGRGGWTWYTGSAGWMYRTGLEAILGLRRQGDSLWFEPCLPKCWPGFTLTYRFGASRYHIKVENSPTEKATAQALWVDGAMVEIGVITLVDDGKEHEVRVLLIGAV